MAPELTPPGGFEMKKKICGIKLREQLNGNSRCRRRRQIILENMDYECNRISSRG